MNINRFHCVAQTSAPRRLQFSGVSEKQPSGSGDGQEPVVQAVQEQTEPASGRTRSVWRWIRHLKAEFKHPDYTRREKSMHLACLLAGIGCTVASLHGITEAKATASEAVSPSSPAIVYQLSPAEVAKQSDNSIRVNGQKVEVKEDPVISCSSDAKLKKIDHDLKCVTEEGDKFSKLPRWEQEKTLYEQVAPSYWIWLLASLATALAPVIDFVHEARENKTEDDLAREKEKAEKNKKP